MPYIRKSDRGQFNGYVENLASRIRGPGELNYVLSLLLYRLWQRNPGYFTGNELMGCLRCVGLEFYRRILGPYEDNARREHGDYLD